MMTIDPGQRRHREGQWRPLAAILTTIVILVGCSQRPAAETAGLYRQQLEVFGTQVEILIWGAEADVAQRAVRRIDRDFQRMHRDWHAWKPGALVRLNRALAAGKRVRAPTDLLTLIRYAKDLYRRSNGLFNPAIGRLIGLWGFHQDRFPTRRPPPARREIKKLLAKRPSMDDIIINDDRVWSRNPAVQLDFGGIAKGYAVDLAIARLRQFGIKHALVNAGGDLRAIGRRGDRPWRAGIRHPLGRGVLATVEVRPGEGVFTSGNYQRFHEHQGLRYPHIIDPRSGWPVKGLSSVTVIHDNGAEADAAATALVIAGPKDWHRIARRMGLRLVMVVDEQGSVTLSPGMVTRVRFQVPGPTQIRLSPPL